MKKVFREFDKSLYSIDIMLYSIMSFMGFFLLNLEISAEVEIYQYTISYFFIFAFFSILAYFLNRRKGDYEFLYFGLINICVSAFIMFNKTNTDIYYIIGNSIIFFILTYSLNKVISCYKLIKSKSINYLPKTAITILIVILSIILLVELKWKMDVAYMIFGYYFLGFGLLSLIEVLLIILFNGKTFRKELIYVLNYDEVKVPEKKVIPKAMKKVNSKRIKPKTQEELEPKKKKRKRKKKTNKENNE